MKLNLFIEYFTSTMMKKLLENSIFELLKKSKVHEFATIYEQIDVTVRLHSTIYIWAR